MFIRISAEEMAELIIADLLAAKVISPEDREAAQQVIETELNSQDEEFWF